MRRYNIMCLLLPLLRPFDGTFASVSGFSPAVTVTRTRVAVGLPHKGHRNPFASSFLAASNDAENDSSNFLSKLPRPTLNQILSVWLVGVAGNRLLEAFPKLLGDYGADSNILLNIALNGALFAGGLYTFVQSLVGIDYSKLEGLDTKSWANEAGKLALEGKVPTDYLAKDGSLYQVATFAGGCFWGTELRYQRQVGVIATAVGYTQGKVDKPNYEQVCSGSTGHTEGIQLIYDPSVVSYERLVNILLDSVDPTQLNRVGNDRGTQYRHGIYPHTDEQMAIARERIESRQSQYTNPIVTEVKPAAVFWPAENYHQRKGGQSAEKNCDERIRCYG